MDYENPNPDVFVEPKIKLMSTLPKDFKCLAGFSIDLTDEKDERPTNLIRLLGDALGVDDYEKNLAAFWFLDFIALQVIRYADRLDKHERSLMISWLAGEMKVIRDDKLSHEDFWQKVRDIFEKCSKRISTGGNITHWNLLTGENQENDIVTQQDPRHDSEGSIVSKERISKHRIDSRKRSKPVLSKDSSRQSMKNVAKNSVDEPETAENIARPEVRSREILNVIEEATYNMYGDYFHYILIFEAFVNPVEIHEYKVPITFRKPRPAKEFANENKMIKEKSMKKFSNSDRPRKSKETGKNKKNGRKIKNQESPDLGNVQETEKPVILNDDEILMQKRQYILPLMESHEASDILAAHKNSQTN